MDVKFQFLARVLWLTSANFYLIYTIFVMIKVFSRLR